MTVLVRWAAAVAAALWIIGLGTAGAETVELEPLLKTLRAAGPRAEGTREAAAAWEKVVQVDADRLPEVLAGLKGAGPIAANWVRTAAETVAERELRDGGKLPTADLEQFLEDRQNDPRARWLAFGLLTRVDPAARRRLAEDKVDDPSLDLRREAVAYVLGDGIQVEESSEPAKAVSLYRRALQYARDPDQIREATQRLRKAGEEVNLARLMGFIVRWKLIGPFDNTGEQGFDVVYPPEKEIEYQAAYEGKHGPVKWIDYTATGDDGKVDFNKAIKEEKAVVGYAVTEFLSDGEREAEFRLTSYNAVELWLNGEPIDSHNVYHGGSQLDQYTSRGVLRKGKNVILVKCCQNEQTQSWAVHWWFQLRLCDELAGPILSTDRE